MDIHEIEQSELLYQNDREQQRKYMNELKPHFIELHNSRHVLNSSMNDLRSSQGNTIDLRINYISIYMRYFVYFCLMLLLFALLVYTRMSQTSGLSELIILILGMLFIIYNGYHWIITMVKDLLNYIKKTLNM